MRFWISACLPMLSLETLHPCWSEPRAYVVIDKERVYTVSPLAKQAGVTLGMRSASVPAIAPDAVLLDRDPEREKIAMDAVSLALLQFTPEIALAYFGLLMDVTASLQLFGGHAALCRRIRAVIRGLGFTSYIGAAPTAGGAWILSRTIPLRKFSIRPRVVRVETLRRQLDAVPCVLLPSAGTYQDWLRDIGCRTLGDLRKLSRAGLQRRTSVEFMAELDRAYGQAPELFDWIEAPATFQAKLDLMERIEHADMLLHGARSLILQLVGWLSVRQLAVTRIALQLQHERGRSAVAPTTIEIALAEPTWRDEHLLRLLQEKLARLTLEAPVIGLRLDALQFEPMLPPTETLFPEPGGTPADFARLLELLSARLGNDNVLSMIRNAEHRPEEASRWLPATAKHPKEDSLQETPERPFWLLDKPLPLMVRDNRPFYGTPLQIIRGPERIEAGWWDDKMVARDYYIAQAGNACCYWIFLERSQHPAWYLHGQFG